MKIKRYSIIQLNNEGVVIENEKGGYVMHEDVAEFITDKALFKAKYNISENQYIGFDYYELDLYLESADIPDDCYIISNAFIFVDNKILDYSPITGLTYLKKYKESLCV